jgi:hypothetical protein
VATGTTGIVLLWSAVTGKGILKSVQDIVRGKAPGGIPAAGGASAGGSASSGNVGAAPGGGNAANRGLGKLLAAPYGWSTGAEWNAIDNIAMAESGWDANAANPTSNARGIAQNINGWGPGYQPGNAGEQISWMYSYIKGRYGDPVKAWEFHVANGWY